MNSYLMPAQDPQVHGVIALYILGDYRYTAGVVSDVSADERILVMGRNPQDARHVHDFEMVPVEEFPEEIIAVARRGFPETCLVATDEQNKVLVERHLLPGLRNFYGG